jgi:hypothetical protein
LECRTYGFIYPELTAFSDELYPSGLDFEEARILQVGATEYADDLTLVSPLHLCLSSGIPPEKVLALYTWAERMILEVHAKEQDFLEEVAQFSKGLIA